MGAREEEIHLLETRKKPVYPIQGGLREYLRSFGRDVDLPVSYADLKHFMHAAPLYDSEGNDTLWETLIYPPEEMQDQGRRLVETYAMLKSEGERVSHLYCDRIDFCSFGNTQPFRVRIVNARNDNQDYYYIKRADASRAYGLELEHLLSPNRMHFLTGGDTLVEEHVVGIPGDVFVEKWLERTSVKPIRLAKELVKFNERCFVRLLGDMRSYNFVMVVTPDFEETQIRIRAMDFDQQSYSGRKNFYLPQFFKENKELVQYCLRHLDQDTAFQYQREEQALIYRRTILSEKRLNTLMRYMCEDRIAPDEKVTELARGLAEHYKNRAFEKCDCMGKILYTSLEHMKADIRRHHAAVGGSRPIPLNLGR